MFRHEEQMIHHAHGLLQPGMEHGAADQRRFDLLEPIYQFHPSLSKTRKDLRQRPGIVIRFLGLAIGEIGDREHISAANEILDAAHPEMLEIEKVSSMLLGRPLVARLAHQGFVFGIMHQLF